MSTAKAKQAEQAENTAEVKETGPVVYCGPTVKNTVKQYTVYADGDMLSDMMNRFLETVPMAKGLLVPIEQFSDTRKALENPKSAAGILFAAVKAAIE